eukprot:TRINITY_DN80786_c0_g1_i1.p1 TRINITY_DN80786_c0_g1~~TRINITY_DN80786_c0_g1_i1.p1  ORF type:complete len:546 (+),score=73.28 TRINITY_DN80786_c0_g1_i1:61-1638(+)
MAERSAKRLKSGHFAASFKPEIQFHELPVDASAASACGAQWCSRAESEKFSAHADSHGNLYVSDSTRIVRFSKDGTCRPLVKSLEPHLIVPNGTADYVVILRKFDKQRLSKVLPDGTVWTVLESSTPLFGPDVCPNGDVVHHPLTSRLERRSSKTGEVIASIEGGQGRRFFFEASSYLTAGQDGYIYFSSKTCMYRWSDQDRTVECIAGHQVVPGRRDGYGVDARFTHLKRPVLTKRFAYVRESDNRLCRVDLETFQVCTLNLVGVDASTIDTYVVTPDGTKMFLIFASPFRIFTADMTDFTESTFCADMQRVDWSGCSDGRLHVEFVAGKERQVYRIDSRILQARSAYFQSMLSSGMREASTDRGPIDLGEDVSAEALTAVFHFLHTDQFDPVAAGSSVRDMKDDELLGVAKFALDVHALGDRFLMPRLCRLCEAFLSGAAFRVSLVLPILASITLPRRQRLQGLEVACWQFVEENWKELVQHHSATLRELVDQGHPLAVELLLASSGVSRFARRAEESELPAA